MHSESLKARITTFPRNECRDTRWPNWSVSVKSGAARARGVPGSSSGLVASAALDVGPDPPNTASATIASAITAPKTRAKLGRRPGSGRRRDRGWGPACRALRDLRRAKRTPRMTAARAPSIAVTRATRRSFPRPAGSTDVAVAWGLGTAPPRRAADGAEILAPEAAASDCTPLSAAFSRPLPPAPTGILASTR